MNLEQYLSSLHVDPKDDLTPQLVWFDSSWPQAVREQMIAQSNGNPYAVLGYGPEVITARFHGPHRIVRRSVNVRLFMPAPTDARQFYDLYSYVLWAEFRVTEATHNRQFLDLKQKDDLFPPELDDSGNLAAIAPFFLRFTR